MYSYEILTLEMACIHLIPIITILLRLSYTLIANKRILRYMAILAYPYELATHSYQIIVIAVAYIIIITLFIHTLQLYNTLAIVYTCCAK